jgi:hypothetical protein
VPLGRAAADLLSTRIKAPRDARFSQSLLKDVVVRVALAVILVCRRVGVSS